MKRFVWIWLMKNILIIFVLKQQREKKGKMSYLILQSQSKNVPMQNCIISDRYVPSYTVLTIWEAFINKHQVRKGVCLLIFFMVLWNPNHIKGISQLAQPIRSCLWEWKVWKPVTLTNLSANIGKIKTNVFSIFLYHCLICFSICMLAQYSFVVTSY